MYEELHDKKPIRGRGTAAMLGTTHGPIGQPSYFSIISQQKTILCVDDDVVGSAIRAEVLEHEGYSVVLHHCPLDALQTDISRFSLAILDFMMPKMNGRELLIRLRGLGATFPIVLLSGLAWSLSYEDRVLFSRCVDKAEPVQSLLSIVASFLDPNEIPDCR